MRNLPLWTPLASICLTLSWLLPNASPPWVAFHKDAWAALILLLVAAVVVFKKAAEKQKFSLDIFSIVLLLLAILTAAQYWSGTIYFSGHATLGVAYLVAACVAVVVSNAWERSSPGAPGDFLFMAFLGASLGTTGLMLIQWLGADASDIWVNEIASSGRPYGNLVQPNNAATLLLLGMVSIYWFITRQKLNAAVGFIGAIYLLFFVALTGSRIGYLSLASMTIIAVVIGFRRAELHRRSLAFAALLMLLPIFIWLITRDWGGSAAISGLGPKLAERPLTSIRVLVYEAYIEAAWAAPWWGNGFGQGVKTQLAAAGLGHELPGLFTWAHNAFLDIATWFGLPAALALIGSIFLVFICLVRAQFQVERSVYFAGVYVVFMHAMVELPHGYAYFLLPTCMLVGAVLARLSIPSILVPGSSVGVVLLGLSVLLLVIVQDYLRVESSFYTWRFKQANIGRVHVMDVPNTRVLNQFQALLIGLRGSAETLDEVEVREFEFAVMLFPSAAAMQHLAEVQLKRGNIAAAQSTADRARLLTKPPERRAMAARWKYLVSQDSRFQSVDWRE